MKLIKTLCLAAVAGFVFFGCESAPVSVQEAAPQEPEKKPELPAPEPELVAGIQPEPKPAPEFPLRPITQEIIGQVIESGDSLKRLQYYISDTVALVKENVVQDVEIRNGAGLRRETSATGQIIIQKETAGVLVNTFFDRDQKRILAVSFDEENDRDILFFSWNSAERRFTLAYDTESRLTGYGDQKYQVRFTGDVPHLLIRFNEEKNNNPHERVVRGRFIQAEN